MPERSSTTSVHTWPDAAVVDAAARAWAARVAEARADVAAVGYLGSYARGDWGPGSDLDLVVVVKRELPPIGERARGWDTSSIPVPVDLLLYSRAEWEGHLERSPRWRRAVEEEAVWVWREP